MGSHDCRVSASINLKPEVTEDDVKRVMKDYLKAQSFTYDRLHEDGSIELEAGSLRLSIDVFGYGCCCVLKIDNRQEVVRAEN